MKIIEEIQDTQECIKRLMEKEASITDDSERYSYKISRLNAQRYKEALEKRALQDAIYLLQNIYANAAESPEWIRDKILRFMHVKEWVD